VKLSGPDFVSKYLIFIYNPSIKLLTKRWKKKMAKKLSTMFKSQYPGFSSKNASSSLYWIAGAFEPRYLLRLRRIIQIALAGLESPAYPPLSLLTSISIIQTGWLSHKKPDPVNLTLPIFLIISDSYIIGEEKTQETSG